ncbi:MAG TPA: acyltransferase [Oculatellaceae cyanobacterium]
MPPAPTTLEANQELGLPLRSTDGHYAQQSAAAVADRLDFLDGLRALTALYVVAYHAFLQVWSVLRGIHPHGVAKFLFGWLAHGPYGVVVFLVVSGFCLMLTVNNSNYQLKEGVLGFFVRRAKRIVPPYYAAIALSFILATTVLKTPLGTHFDICLPATLDGLKGNLLFIPELTKANTNHVFWSIGVEAKVYLFFPLALFLWRRIGGISTTALMLLAGIYVPTVSAELAIWCTHYLGLFALGMLAADFKTRGHIMLTQMLKVASVLLVALIGALTWFVPAQVQIDHGLEFQLTVGATTAVIMCLMKNGEFNALKRFLSNKWLQIIGVASYSLYLIHAPLLQLYTKFVTQPLLAPLYGQSVKLASFVEILLFLFGALPLIVLAALAFGYVFEGRYFKKGMSHITASHSGQS